MKFRLIEKYLRERVSDLRVTKNAYALYDKLLTHLDSFKGKPSGDIADKLYISGKEGPAKMYFKDGGYAIGVYIHKPSRYSQASFGILEDGTPIINLYLESIISSISEDISNLGSKVLIRYASVDMRYSFVHEYTHLKDYIKSVGKSKRVITNDINIYLNNKLEINAFLKTFYAYSIDFIDGLLDSKYSKDSILNYLDRYLGSFSKFIGFFEEVFYQTEGLSDYLSYLNEDNYKRVIKRLKSIYDDLLLKKEEMFNS